MEHGDCSDTLHELYHFLDGELTDRAMVPVSASAASEAVVRFRPFSTSWRSPLRCRTPTG